MAVIASPRLSLFLHFTKGQAIFARLKVSSIRNLCVTSCHCREFQNPSPTETASLNKRFPHPVKTICAFLEPMTAVKPEHHFTMDVKSSRYLRPKKRWKVSLKFTWPERFSVAAVNTNLQEAVNGAFLEACRTLENIGLLRSDGEEVSFVEHLMAAKRKAETTLPCELLRIHSKCELLEDGSECWHSKVKLWWPTYIMCQDVGLTQSEALRNAAVHTFIKLKAGGFLDKNNCIKEVSRISLPQREIDTQFTPDYEVYVDSTSYAYGAYLLTHDVEGSDDLVPWINAQWSDDLKPHFMTPKANSSMFEFCAVLATIYTWKKKLVGKSVLVYNDNLHTVQMINEGVPLSIRGRRPMYCKVFAVLRDTCAKYDIELKAQHIVRSLNKPADCLSKSKVSDFKKMVPNAKMIAKKSKQILFCLPLVDPHTKEKKYAFPEKTEVHSDSFD